MADTGPSRIFGCIITGLPNVAPHEGRMYTADADDIPIVWWKSILCTEFADQLAKASPSMCIHEVDKLTIAI